MSNQFHINDESHHHHSHSKSSVHKHGHHVFQLEDVSVAIEKTVFKKHRLFPQTVTTNVLKNCNLSLHSGETLFLIGESGSGKSMLMNVLSGTLPNDANLGGRVWFEGNEISQNKLFANAIKNINYVPQSLISLDPTRKYALDGKEYYPHEMSGGMKRLALIEATCQSRAKITIADEPTEGLDNKRSNAVMKRLIELKGDDGCLLVVTHDVELALKYANRIAIFKDGTIVEETSTKSFLDGNIEHQYTKKMFESIPARACFVKNKVSPNKQIEISDVTIKFDNKTVIEQMSETISSNEITCLFGETGSGKSTFCKALAGWIKPCSGHIDSNASVQYIPQNPFDGFNPKLTIRKSLGSRCVNSSIRLDDKLLDRKPNELSGGELQRFAIIRALSQRPDFLILDESTSMLDVVTQKEIIDEILKQREKLQFGLILVTHDKNLMNKLADHIIYF